MRRDERPRTDGVCLSAALKFSEHFLLPKLVIFWRRASGLRTEHRYGIKASFFFWRRNQVEALIDKALFEALAFLANSTKSCAQFIFESNTVNLSIAVVKSGESWQSAEHRSNGGGVDA